MWRRIVLAVRTIGRKCRLCHADRVTALYCEKHRRQLNRYSREKMRQYNKCKTRKLNSESYSWHE